MMRQFLSALMAGLLILACGIWMVGNAVGHASGEKLAGLAEPHDIFVFAK